MAILAAALATSSALTSLPCATSEATFAASSAPMACTAAVAAGPPTLASWATWAVPMTASRDDSRSPVSGDGTSALVDSTFVSGVEDSRSVDRTASGFGSSGTGSRPAAFRAAAGSLLISWFSEVDMACSRWLTRCSLRLRAATSHVMK